MRFLDSYTEQLKQAVKLQKATIDGLNKVVGLQQRQLDDVMQRVMRHLELDVEEMEGEA